MILPPDQLVRWERVDQGLIHVSIRKLYSYCSRINQSTSFLDHFLFSRELLKHVVKFSIIDDMENSSDHLPVLIGVNLPINEVSCETTSRFIPTPQWFKATQEQLNHYRELLDSYLKSIIIPYHLVVCTDVHCTRHMSEI